MKLICEAVQMSRQNYYKGRSKRRERMLNEEMILKAVRKERSVQPRIGCRKLLHILSRTFEISGIKLGRDRFFGLLRRYSLLIQRKRLRARTTDSCHHMKVYGNLLKDANLSGPGQAMVSDITYIRTDEGFMYVALVMDAYSRAILGYNCSDTLEREGAVRALSMALKHIESGSGAIHHSDRGSQYCSWEYVRQLESHGIRISMTEENHCYENGMAERLNGILKQEYGLGEVFLNKRDAIGAVEEAVRLYNYRRPHQSLGYRCPMAVQEAA